MADQKCDAIYAELLSGMVWNGREILVGLPLVIPDEILLFLFYLFSSIISKTIAFICAFQ